MAVMELEAVQDFGSVEAKYDTLLVDSFRDHPAYKAVRDMKKFLVSGRKGSGKTAIYSHLIRESVVSDSIEMLGFEFNDYPWHHHARQAQEGVPEERRFIQSWKYLILIGVASLLLQKVNQRDLSDSSFDSFQRLRDFVTDSYGRPNPSLTSVFQPKRRLHLKGLFKLSPTGFGELGFESDTIAIEGLPAHFREVNNQIFEDVLNVLPDGIDYFVGFDEIDLGFDFTDPMWIARLNGLILAAREIFAVSRNRNKRLSAIVFIRSDIFDRLKFEDKNKIARELTAVVSWDENAEMSLMQLMEARFAARMDNGNVKLLAWDRVFSGERIDGKRTQYSYIRDRTMLRPRDIIYYCNQVLDQYKAAPSTDGRFANEHILAARAEYSNYLRDEISEEMRKHVAVAEELFDLLTRLGAEVFSLDDFSAAMESFPGLEGSDALHLLKDLYEFSVIGFLRPGGASAGSTYIFAYEKVGRKFDREAKAFKVHPGLKESLELTRPYAKGAK
ncbi:hypothetical protein M3C30_003570 [Micrococcus luteus]|nr:hypothetical protein [Micrococcus luteus]